MAAAVRPSWHRAIIVLSSVVTAAILIGVLYWARPILIPIVVAIFFSFLLNPVVKFLHHRGLRRTPATLLSVACAAVLVAGLSWLLTAQLYDLAGEIPEYRDNIKARVESIRAVGKDSLLDRMGQLVEDVTATWKKTPEGAKVQAGEGEKSVVAIESSGSGWVGELTHWLGTLVEVVASAALAVALVIFMLLKREDLRNRVIWFTGRSSLTLTTKALDDVGQRISRFLLMQLAINSMFGLAMGIGLAIIGIDHAILWGVLAAVMRYVPYLGAPLSALFPLILSLAQYTGWAEPLEVAGLVIVLELVTANFIEPMLFGRSVGISEVALLIAAGFWTFLWGPIGLILSGPLTVCLFVVGQYVPGLRFLAVLLGDEPALEPDATLFQRLAAGDEDEAMEIVQKYATDHTPEQLYDALLLPALSHIRRAEERAELNETDEQFIRQAFHEIIEELAEAANTPTPDAETKSDVEEPPERDETGAFPESRKKVRILACPARDEWDALSLNMLKNLLDSDKWEVAVVDPTTLASELIPLIKEQEPAIVCIGAPPPGGLSHTRYLCKRLRSAFPKLKIIVGRWGLRSGVEQNQQQLRAAGADEVDVSLSETASLVNGWLPVLHSQLESTKITQKV